MSHTNPRLLAIDFVEARPFASRLDVLAPMLRGACQLGIPVKIHLPHRVGGADLDRFLEVMPEGVEVVYDNQVPEGTIRDFQAGAISVGLAENAYANARRMDRGSLLTVLTAVDDYPRELLWLAFRARISGSKLLLVRYRVSDLIGEAKGVKGRARRMYFALGRALGSAKVVVFDERILPSKNLAVIPDPWSKPFGDFSHADARVSLGWDSTTPVVLLVGHQDARKGFAFSADLLLRYASSRGAPRIIVRIVGSIEESLREKLEQLRGVYGGRLVHTETYLPDDELALIMAASDVVLMPYHSRFKATSGVLIRSAASGTPVLASSTGLVGWRVREHGLGVVVEPGDLEAGAEQLRFLLQERPRIPAGSNFVARSSPAGFARVFRDLLLDVR